MIIASARMSKFLKIKFDRKDMDSIRDMYENIFGIDKLVRAFDIASIVA